MHSVQVSFTSTMPINATVVQYKMYKHKTGLTTFCTKDGVRAASDQCRWHTATNWSNLRKQAANSNCGSSKPTTSVAALIKEQRK